MGLPDPSSATTWGGKLLVDRDGMDIGICTQIFVDDATGLPEWATADVTGGTAFIPLMDAVESGPRVRVAVRGVDVAGAPPVGDVQHLSEDEEERLYRHYGIHYSRSASQSGLPVATDDTASDQPEADVIGAAEAETAGSSRARRLLMLLGLGAFVALGALAGAVLRSRRRPLPPPTRVQQVAAGARAASSALDARGRQALAAALPVLQTGGRLSVTAAQRAATQAAIRANAAAALAAAQASVLAARANAVRGAFRTHEVVAPTPAGDERRTKAVAAVTSTASFAAGYLVGSRAGQARLERVREATATWAQSPAVQDARTRVRAGVTDTLQTGNARLTRSATDVAGRLRRRSGGEHASRVDEVTDPASPNGSRAGSPENP
jgi:hypothetical protein